MYELTDGAEPGRSATGNPYLLYTAHDAATGERVVLTVIVARHLWHAIPRHVRGPLARRAALQLLRHERDQWDTLPGWRRAEVPVCIEYECFLPASAGGDS